MILRDGEHGERLKSLGHEGSKEYGLYESTVFPWILDAIFFGQQKKEGQIWNSICKANTIL